MRCCERFSEGVRAVHKIQKVIRVGDLVYPPRGKPQKITSISSVGFYCGRKHYFYDEHGSRYYLTEAGLKSAKRSESNAKT